MPAADHIQSGQHSIDSKGTHTHTLAHTHFPDGDISDLGRKGEIRGQFTWEWRFQSYYHPVVGGSNLDKQSLL